MPTLNNKSSMPWGIYEGIPMDKVPAEYLYWLWDDMLRNNHMSPVARYIRDSLDELSMKYPKGKWRKTDES